MRKDDPNAPPLLPVQINVKALIGDASVNAWAKDHKLVQTTIARIVNGTQDPTTAYVQELAKAFHLEAWQLLAPDLGASLYAIQNERVVPVVDERTAANLKIAPPLSPMAKEIGAAFDRTEPARHAALKTQIMELIEPPAISPAPAPAQSVQPTRHRRSPHK